MSLRLALSGLVSGLAALSMLSTPALAAGKRANESWGRAGIAFDQYLLDALECANRAYGVEVEMRPIGPLATGWLGSVLPAAIWTGLTPGRVPIYTTTYVEAYVRATRHDVISQLQPVVDTCLIEKGYQRFRLTSAQMRGLRRLEPGSTERHAYLHRLGADAQVLATQAIPERRRRAPSWRAGQS